MAFHKINRSNSPTGRINGNTIPSLYRTYLRQKIQSCQKTEVLPNNKKRKFNEPNLRAEIEHKFNNSIINKNYIFPRKLTNQSIEVNQQLADVTIYNLAEQNIRGRATTTYLKTEGDDPEELEMRKMGIKQQKRNYTENHQYPNPKYIIKQIQLKMPNMNNSRIKTEQDEKRKYIGPYRLTTNGRKFKLK